MTPRNRPGRTGSVDHHPKVCPRPTHIPATPRLAHATLPQPSGHIFPQYESTSAGPYAQGFPQYESTSTGPYAQGFPQYESTSTGAYAQAPGNSVVYESVTAMPFSQKYDPSVYEPVVCEPIVSGSVTVQPLPRGSQVYDARDQGRAPQQGPFSPMVSQSPLCPQSVEPISQPPPDPTKSQFCTATENVDNLNANDINADEILGWPISPVFAQERWSPLVEYRVVEKACMLATRFLEGTTAGFVFLHTVMNPYDPDDDEAYPDIVANHELVPQPRYQARNASPSATDWQKVHGTLTRIAQYITIDFGDTGTAAGITTQQSDKFVIIHPSDAYFETDGQGAHITLDINSYYILNGLRIENPDRKVASAAREVTEIMLLTQTLLHEFAHALWYAVRGDEHEPYWRDEQVAELGFAFTNSLFGGTIDVAAQAIPLTSGTKELYYINHYGDSACTQILSQEEVQIGALEGGILVNCSWPDYAVVGAYDTDGSEEVRKERGLWQRGPPLWAMITMARMPFWWISRYMTNEFWDRMTSLSDRTPDVFHCKVGPVMVRILDSNGDGTFSPTLALVQ